MRNQVLGNRYRILERIGEGGMAFVYVALDEKLGRKVAIKILHEHMEKNPDIRMRFQMEAQAISTLEHPNIVKIYDFSGDHSERLWIVTEVIRGKNLAQYVQQFSGGWLHPALATCIVREILKALNKAHSQGIVHRDIKPENVMVTSDGRVKLMDFGIAKDLGRSNVTQTGTFMGSPSYMSSEQIRGRDVDLRSDLYSLSVLFYEIITGRLPFVGLTTHDVILKIMEAEFTHPRYIVPQLPLQLNEMIVRGMSKEPILRYQSATEYGQDIEHFLTEMQIDESHIELERFFKDREAWEARINNSRFGKDTETRPQRQRAHMPQVPEHLPAASTVAKAPYPAAEVYSPAHAQARPKPPTHTQHLAAQAKNAQRTDPPRAESLRRDLGLRESVPPPPVHAPSAPVRPSEREQEQARREQLQREHAQREQLQREQQRERQQRERRIQAQRAYRPHIREKDRRARYQRSNFHTSSSWSGVFFGAMLLLSLALIGIWGFGELQGRLSHEKHRAFRVNLFGLAEKPGKTTRKAKRYEGTPVNIKKLNRAPGTNNNNDGRSNRDYIVAQTSVEDISSDSSRRDNTTSDMTVESFEIRHKKTNKIDKEKDKEKERRNRKPTRAAATRENLAREKPDASDKTLIETSGTSSSKTDAKTEVKIEDLERAEKPTDKNAANSEVKESTVATPATTATGAASSTAPTPPTPAATTTPKGGQGKLIISSQPAAEIFINGKRSGTSVDRTSDSGPLNVPAGRVVIELRRQGYNTYRTKIDIAAGETKNLPRVILESGGAVSNETEIASKVVLTIRVSHVPAQLTIRATGNNSTQAMTLKVPVRTLELDPGKYTVKVEYKGEVRERELNLGGQSQLTFSADFREKNEAE